MGWMEISAYREVLAILKTLLSTWNEIRLEIFE